MTQHKATKRQQNRRWRIAAASSLTVAFATAACATVPAVAPLAPEQEAFWARLLAHCGQAYEGRVTLSAGNPADTAFARERLVMHVRECSPTEIRVPFYVGDDRSREWVFTRTATGLRLKHDHRHEDGQPDSVTMYGGDTRERGDTWRQSFPADEFTASLNPLFRTNVWTVEFREGVYIYNLERIGTERRFRAEFDFTRPVATPPPPWRVRQ
jgi:hypothetical protein